MRMNRRTRRKSTQEKKEPPQSPPEEEKGKLPYSYTPKSPPYPPPEDDDWETESLPRLVTPDEDQDTMTTQGRKSLKSQCQLTKMLIRTSSMILKDS